MEQQDKPHAAASTNELKNLKSEVDNMKPLMNLKFQMMELMSAAQANICSC